VPTIHKIRFLAVLMAGVLVTAGAARAGGPGDSRGAAQIYDLARCIRTALERNPQIQAYRELVRSAEAEVRAAVGGFLPSAAVDISRTTIRNDGTLTLDTDYLDQERSVIQWRVQQNLFNGWATLTRVERSRLVKAFRREDLKAAELTLTADVKRAFYQLLGSRARAEAARSQVSRLESQLEVVKAYERLQLRPRLDVLQVEVELEKARRALEAAWNAEETARIRLNTLLGVSGEVNFAYRGDLEDFSYDPPISVEPYLARSGDRPEVKKAEINYRVSRKEERLTLSQALPRVDLTGSWIQYQRDYDEPALRDDDLGYYTVALNVTVPLFQGGQVYHSLAAQRHQSQRYRRELENLVNEVEREIRTRFLALQDAHGRIASARKILSLALETYDSAQVRYRTGVGSITDVLNAQADVTDGEVQLSTARADFLVALADLERAAGMAAQ
jgi:outer membrane protein